MTFPPNDSPLWAIIRLVVTGLIAYALLSLLYQNGFSKTDIVTILGILLGLAGVDGVRRFAGRKADE